MRRALRPWVTASVALTGAGLFAVNPLAPPPPDAQERPVKLTSGSSDIFGDFTGAVDQALGSFSPDFANISTSFSGVGDPLTGLFTGVDAGAYPTAGLSELIANTEADLTGLESIIGTNPFPLFNAPDATTGLQTVFTDLLQGQLSSPTLNPISLLIEGGLLDLSPLYGPNAALDGLGGIASNIESAVSAGNYEAVLENFFLAPTTIANDFLNGYQPGTAGTPFTNLISPEFGLLTNPQGGPELATGTVNSFQMLEQTIADELSGTGGANLTSDPTLLGPGNLDLSVNVDSILNSLAGGSQDLTLPITPDDVISGLATNGDITVPITPDDILSGLATNGNLTIPVSPAELAQIVTAATANPAGNIVIPITPDDLVGDFANSSGNIALPITYDQIAGDVLGGSGSLSVGLPEETILSDIFPKGVPDGLGYISLSTVEKLLGISSSSTIPVSIQDSTLLSTLDSALNASGVGKDDISIPASTLDSIFGSSGGNDITIPASDVTSLLNGDTSDITIPLSSVESLFGGTAGNTDISIPASNLEQLLGGAGSTDISIPLSTLDAFLPANLDLNLPIPEVTGTVPTYSLDLSQDLLAVAGSIAPLSSALPTLLTPDPTIDLIPLLSGVVNDLGLPVSITGGDIPLDLTGVTAELLNALIPNGTSGGALDLSGLLGGTDLSGLLGGTDLSGLLDAGGSGLTAMPIDFASALLGMF